MLAVIPGRRLATGPSNSAVMSMVSLEGSMTGPTSTTLASWRSSGAEDVTTISSVPFRTRPQVSFRQCKFHPQGRDCRNPKQAIILRDFLPRANVASRHDAIEGSCDSGLFHFKLQGAKRLLRDSQVLSLALHLELGGVVLELCLLFFGLGDDVRGPQLLGAIALRFCATCALDSQFLRSASMLRAFAAAASLSAASCRSSSWARTCPFFTAVPVSTKDLRHHSIALGSQIDLILHHDGARSDVVRGRRLGLTGCLSSRL
jgi:hypothetical protein